MRADEKRTAALLFSGEPAASSLRASELDRSELKRAVRERRFLKPPTRLLERLAMKRGLIGFERNCLRPYLRARYAVLGREAEGAPRLLVRVDEFPHYRAWDEPERFGMEGFRRFHEIMRSAGVPYLIATLPRVARNPLDPSETAERELDVAEKEMIEELRRDGVAFAVHGWCHRTRRVEPRRRSELAGLDGDELARLLDRADGVLAGLGVEAPVFVPPFNRFDARQYPLLARRYEVVCGGPETVSVLGFRKTPIVLGGSVFLPSYPPFYGRASELLPAVRRLLELHAALWVPIVLHWGWELEAGWTELERLAGELAGYAVDWGGFLSAVRESAESADKVAN
ncbi:MAG: DUF2334 domain-containing protein [Gaiellaceae bacterium]